MQKLISQAVLVIGSLLIGLMLSGCDQDRSNSSIPADWTFDPAGLIGGITPSSKQEDIVKIFGAENVETIDLPIGEGMTVPGTRVYGKTANELLIEWKENEPTPARITISRPGTQWKTSDGITLGTSLEELEKINGHSFKLTGFRWDYPGRTVSWEGGKLPAQLQLDLEVAKEVPEAELQQVTGDTEFDSSHPVFKQMQLKVKTIHLVWETY